MEHTDFTEKSPGSLNELVDGGWAFQPDPLPPAELGFDNWSVLEEASAALGKLSGELNNINLGSTIMSALLRRESLASSRIEGTKTDIQSVALHEISGKGDQDSEEASSHLHACAFGIEQLNNGAELNLNLVKQLHYRLLSNARGREKSPGYLRRGPAWIGGKDPSSARFVFATPDYANGATEELFEYIQGPLRHPILVEGALVHYQFETIHPFRDGNGRLGRLLLQLFLYKNLPKLNATFNMSPYFERNRDEYIQKLFDVSRKGNWSDWIEFFLAGVVDEAERSSHLAHDVMKLWDDSKAVITANSSSNKAVEALNLLYSRMVLTAPLLESELKVTNRTAQLLLKKLVELNIAREINSASKPRAYSDPRLLRLLSGS